MALSPGATAVSSSRPGAPPAPSAAPAPRAPSRSADPAPPRRDARVARTAQAPGLPVSDPPEPRTLPRSRSQRPTRLHPALATGAAVPPRRRQESGALGEALRAGPVGGWGAQWSRCVPSPCPRALISSKQCRRHLGPNSPRLPLLPILGASVWAEETPRTAWPWGLGDAMCVCTASWPCTPEVTVISHRAPRVHMHRAGPTHSQFSVSIDWPVWGGGVGWGSLCFGDPRFGRPSLSLGRRGH